jgi:protein gp37
MAEVTGISWCDSTFNAVIGCQKVSAGCDNCYAETLMDKRYHKVQWGPHGERKRTSKSNWQQPIKWNKNHAAFSAENGRRQRVFSSSLSDVFDNQWVPQDRVDLWYLIHATPYLDWLLLTKRPENVSEMLPPTWDLFGPGWPNVWLGATCEDQAAYDRRWPILQKIPARVRFISYEPAIGPLTMHHHRLKPDWLIAGGETGQGHRWMKPTWFYALKDECEREAVPFFVKQMAGRKPIPDDLLVRQFPVSPK